MPSEFGLLDLDMLKKEYMLEYVKLVDQPEGYMGEKYFPSKGVGSNIVQWETEFQHAGLAQYVDKGGKPNRTFKKGSGLSWQEVAYKEEAEFLSADDMRWKRKEGTQELKTMEDEIQEVQDYLTRRVINRNEWEFVNAMRGSMAIKTVSGSTVTLDYKVPSTNKVDITNQANDVWTNTDADILSQLEEYAGAVRFEGQEKILMTSTYAINLMSRNKSILAHLGEKSKETIAVEGKLIRIMGMDIVPYDVSYAVEYSDGNLPPALTRFTKKNEIFILPKSKPIGKRPVAATVKSGGMGQRFMHSWETKEFEWGTWLVVGEYSLPIIQNRWGFFYGLISADPDAQ